MSHSPGSEECPFPYPGDDSRDCSPDSPLISHLRPQRVHSGTQTEGPQLSPVTPDAGCSQPSLFVPTTPTLSSCPSPVPQRKHRYCVKWENRATVVHKPKEPEEESKPTYESLESVSVRATFYIPQELRQYLNAPQLYHKYLCVFPRITRGCRKPMRHYVGS